MTAVRLAALLALLPALCRGADPELKTTPLYDTPLFDRAKAVAAIEGRIGGGHYDGYYCELCTDDPAVCEADPAFAPYKSVDGGTTSYILVVKRGEWAGLPPVVREAALREIVYSSWGHPKRPYSPVSAVFAGGPLGDSPLALLARSTAARYLQYTDPGRTVGGLGVDAYGENCWFTAIAAVADGESAYARTRRLAPSDWGRPRFMGPVEFRLHMTNFEQVSEPQFGDIIRYYTNDPEQYGGLVFGGELHSAVFVGRETTTDATGAKVSRDIALNKNTRAVWDFMVFQDVRGLDKDYLSTTAAGGTDVDDRTKVRRGYFRVRQGAAVLDPASVGQGSGAHAGYLADTKNYAERWLCMAGLLPPVPASSNCRACYPKGGEFITLPTLTSPPAAMPSVVQLKSAAKPGAAVQRPRKLEVHD